REARESSPLRQGAVPWVSCDSPHASRRGPQMGLPKMDFTISKEHRLLQRKVREFAQSEIAPLAHQIDEEKEIPQQLIQKMARLGLLGIPFPQEYGGSGAGEVGYCLMTEEIGKASTSVAALLGAHIGIGATAIYLDGTEEQKQKYLTPLARGEKIAAFALTEPQAGSDAAAIKTRAVRDGDHFILNGSKIWITNGPIADIVSVFAVTDPALGARGGVTAFIVESDYPGFAVGTIDEKMGIEGSATGELVFTDCPVPAENVLGQFGAGFITAMKTLDIGRLGLGAGSLGGAEAALELCVRFATTQKEFGKLIAHQQSVQMMIADMVTEIEALRSLVYRTAWMVDTGRPFTRLAAACKLFGSEVASRCIDRAVQIHRELGYLRGYPIELGYRDARIGEIFEGTNEIQRIIIASDIFREAGVRTGP
ncbi:MAG: acyl-CoA dehydrogenase family protein, partial [Anaerolineae bacterium]